jgi:ATP-dependent DNA helicase RecQ
MTYKEILKQYWGYDNFRGIQKEIIESIGNGHDTLGLMPTGGGKSITFQVPALAQPGLCLVITPLIALMKDQVRNLRDRGIKALAVYSGMTREEIIVALENCIFGDYKFLYISPERLDTEIFRSKLRNMKVSMITVDESHCISQWGYDFRPAYLKIAEIRELLPDIPVLALTATATPVAPRRVRKGRKVQITLTITEPLLDRVDELASQIGQSRAAVINLAVMQMLQSGLRIEGE